ncbi:MAG: PQQ-dependent sugar dehydrogenase [Bacteroidetes bacterium]|nr:PQQ-dependent sugar dehydrogenase [Bacteroidota bacterium]
MAKLYSSIRAGILLLFISLFITPLRAQPPVITYLTELTGLTAPINVTNAGDGSNRLFILQQNGIILVRDGATVTQFANFGTTGANIVLYGGEQGLLSMAFHPQYDGISNRYFYIYHNTLAGDIAISRCETTAGNPNLANTSTITNIITVPHPTNSNHNGGQVRFGPDGYLYFATGDGGGGNDGPNNAQTGTVLLGKMLRIDVDHTSGGNNYAIPADNPYVGDPTFAPEVYNLGLRNPYRWSFDRLTGDLWIGDVGQNAREEVDYRPAGSTGHNNFGWRCFEGHISTPGVPDCTPTDYVPPVFDYPNPDSGRSVTCGFVYRGSEYPALYGRFVATDVYSGINWVSSPNGNGGFDSVAQAATVTFIVAFGEAEDGTLYAVSQGTNTLYKVVPVGGTVLPVKILDFSGIALSGKNQLNWKTGAELNTAKYHIEFSRNGYAFTRVSTVLANRSGTGSNYSFVHTIENSSTLYYRLVSEEDNGNTNYSQVIRIKGTGKDNVRVYPTVVRNGNLQLELNGNTVRSIRLLNSMGAVVFKKNLQQSANTVSVTLPVLSGGNYVLQLEKEDGVQTEKIIIN